MPNSKISQLTDGGAAQAADEFVVARGSDNRRIDGASVAAAATSVGTLTSLGVTGNVSIGTTGNTAKVNIYRTGNADMLVLENGGNAGVNLRWKRPNREYSLSLDINNNGGTDFTLYDYTASAIRWLIDGSGNMGLGVSTFGTNAANVLALGNGTEPSSGPANTVQIYSVDRSAGNTIPAIYCEGSGVIDAGITSTTVTHKVALKVNGTVYYLLATTNAT